MEVSGRHVDLIEEGIDVAIRIGRLSDSSLVARCIGDMRMITLALAGYLAQRGTPRSLDALRNHQRIGYVYRGDIVGWGFHVDGRPTEAIRPGLVHRRFRSGQGLPKRPSVVVRALPEPY